MEDIAYIIMRGVLIGVLISAPMGPIGMLCIQRTLSKGRWPAFFTGVGAAFSDIFYCLLTGLGLSFITDFITSHQLILQIIGSLVIIIYGIYLLKNNPTRDLKTPTEKNNKLFKNIGSGFLLTLSNPLILFFIISLFARFNFLNSEYRFYHYILGFISIFGGALLWWYFITFSVNKVRSHFNMRSLWLLNRIVATILIIMAVVGFTIGLKDYLHTING